MAYRYAPWSVPGIRERKQRRRGGKKKKKGEKKKKNYPHAPSPCRHIPSRPGRLIDVGPKVGALWWRRLARDRTRLLSTPNADGYSDVPLKAAVLPASTKWAVRLPCWPSICPFAKQPHAGPHGFRRRRCYILPRRSIVSSTPSHRPCGIPEAKSGTDWVRNARGL